MTKEANMKKTSTFRVFFWSRGRLGLGELEGWLCKFGGGGPAARAAASRYGARGARQRQNWDLHSTWISSQEEDNDEEEKGEEAFLDQTSGPPTTFHNIGILDFYSIWNRMVFKVTL